MRLIFLSLLAGLLLCGCGKEKDKDVKKASTVVGQTIKAETARAVVQQMPAIEAVAGRVVANEEVVLATRFSGFLEKSLCEPGKLVKTGDILFNLDSKEIASRLAALNAEIMAVSAKKASVEAELAYASSSFKRIDALKKADAATADEFDKAKSRLEAVSAQSKSMDGTLRQLEASVKEVQSQLVYTQIKSPVNGVITSCPVDTGSFVSPGVTLAKVDSRSTGYSLLANVDQSYLPRLSVGQELEVEAPYLGLKGMFKIREIAPAVDPATNTFPVKVALTGDNLKSGVFGRLYLSKENRSLVVIPASAIVKRGGLTGVYVVNDDKSIQWRLIRIGEGFGEYVSVLSGIENREMVVVSNLSQIREGMRLE